MYLNQLYFKILFLLNILTSLCKAQTDCSTNLDCNNEKCLKLLYNCTLGYVAYNNETRKYKQKSQNTIYWISLLVGILGADWFYLVNGFNLYIIICIIKLAISLTFIIGISYLFFWYICNKKD